jgi:isopenicillin N synthase-like dioxygenase
MLTFFCARLGGMVFAGACSSAPDPNQGTMASTDDELVPTVDLAPLESDDPSERARVASAVAAACETSGFLQVVGHGIPESTIAAMRAASDEFFALPLERKLLVRPAHPGINRGYAARGTEALSYSLGIEAPSPDLFEAFNIGLDPVPDDEFYRKDPHDFFAPNVWPADVPSLRPALLDYFDSAGQTLGAKKSCGSLR